MQLYNLLQCFDLYCTTISIFVMTFHVHELNQNQIKMFVSVHTVKVGDHCQAVFTEDGQIYDAVIKSVNHKSSTCWYTSATFDLPLLNHAKIFVSVYTVEGWRSLPGSVYWRWTNLYDAVIKSINYKSSSCWYNSATFNLPLLNHAKIFVSVYTVEGWRSLPGSVYWRWTTLWCHNQVNQLQVFFLLVH